MKDLVPYMDFVFILGVISPRSELLCCQILSQSYHLLFTQLTFWILLQEVQAMSAYS